MQQPTVAIWKFELATHDQIQRFEAPHIVDVLDIQLQDGNPVMWVRVWKDSHKRTYILVCKQTGDDVVGATSHLGTVQLKDGTVLHYFGGGPGL